MFVIIIVMIGLKNLEDMIVKVQVFFLIQILIFFGELLSLWLFYLILHFLLVSLLQWKLQFIYY